MKDIYISIIMPCYNAAKFVESAILSVLNQPKREIELIIVDDGSADETEQICQKYIGDIVHYYRTENMGAGHARNYGLMKARGTWISYLDSDDLYLPNSLNDCLFEKLTEYEKNGKDIVYTPWCSADMELKNKLFVVNAEPEDEIRQIPVLTFWTSFYRRRYLIDKAVRFYEYQKQDIESAFRFLAFSRTKEIVTDNQIKFYLQRNNPESNTHTWRQQTVHGVKAQVYYDLYRNYSSEISKKELLKIMLESLERYYMSCQHIGIEDECDCSQMNEIVRTIIKTDWTNIWDAIGGRQFFKLYARYSLVRLTKKKVMEKEVKEQKEVLIRENSEEVMRRLKIANDYLH